jgi:hypothetical protein
MSVRTIFVGDIHGCAEEFKELLVQLDFRRGEDRLFLTGDAFSKGPAPEDVWTCIQRSGANMVLGNHEVPLLTHLEQHAGGSSPTFEKLRHEILFEQLVPFTDTLLPWLQQLPLYLEDPEFLLVHAGINPEAGLQGTTRDQFLAIRTWPVTKGLEGPRWHDHLEPGDRPIIFGHDAPGGLVLKYAGGEERPYAVGLDSGCVYGGQLSAYLLDENRIVQVESVS